MKKIVFLAVVVFLFSCKDSPVDVDKVSFDTETVYSCVDDVSTRFLYKIQGNQVLILDLSARPLTHTEGVVQGEIPTNYKLIYRSFNKEVSSKYFCSDYPPFSPQAISESEAIGGKVTITTQKMLNSAGEEVFQHLISISNIVLKNDSGEKIINSQLDFGIFTTTEQ